MARKSKLTLFHDQVGTVPDREIAAMVGVSIATVCHYRQRHDIPSYRSRLTSDEPPPSAQPPARHMPSSTPSAPRAVEPQHPTGAKGYRATIQTAAGSTDIIVVATDFVKAATLAANCGKVVEMTFLAPAIG